MSVSEVLLSQPLPLLIILRDINPLDLENDRPGAIIAAGNHHTVIIGPAFHDGTALQGSINIAADVIPCLPAEVAIHKMIEVILLWSTLQRDQY